MVWALRRVGAASPLVAADVDTWTVNAAVSGGVLAGFLLAAGLRARPATPAPPRYVDPAMVALVVLLSIAVPVRMAAGRPPRAPQPRAPPRRSSPAWRRWRAARSATCRCVRLWIRAIQPGRTAYVVVHVLVPPGTRARPRRPPTACAAR